MEKWSGLSEDEVYSSIVRVENRCLGQAVFAPPIALLTELIFDDRRSVIQAISERLHRERDSFIPGKDLDEKLHQIAKYAYDLLDKGERECDLEAGFLRFLLAAYVGGLRMKIKEIKSSGNGNKEESPETLEFDA